MGASGLNLGQIHDRSTTRWHRERESGDDVTLDFNAHIRGGGETGPNPTDRGRTGSKRHLVTDAKGIPLAIRLTATNIHDSHLFEDLIDDNSDYKTLDDEGGNRPLLCRSE